MLLCIFLCLIVHTFHKLLLDNCNTNIQACHGCKVTMNIVCFGLVNVAVALTVLERFINARANWLMDFI